MKVLVGVMGCEKNAASGLHRSIRETWGKDFSVIPTESGLSIDVLYFVGRGYHPLLEDEPRLDVPDDKDNLLYKVVGICRWALDHGYDSIFKVNTSSYVNVAEVLKTGHWRFDYAGAVVGRLGEKYSGTDAYGFIQGSASWLSAKAARIVVGDALSFALHHKDEWMRWNGWIAPYLHSEDLWIAQVLTPYLSQMRIATDQGYGNGPLTWWSQSNYTKCYKMDEWLQRLHGARPNVERMRAIDAEYPKGWQT